MAKRPKVCSALDGCHIQRQVQLVPRWQNLGHFSYFPLVCARLLSFFFAGRSKGATPCATLVNTNQQVITPNVYFLIFSEIIESISEATLNQSVWFIYKIAPPKIKKMNHLWCPRHAIDDTLRFLSSLYRQKLSQIFCPAPVPCHRCSSDGLLKDLTADVLSNIVLFTIGEPE